MARFDAGMQALLDTFEFETNELLENLDEILLRTEEDELTSDDIAEIFRIMHTIKGSASMMGLQNMSVLAHAVEDLFFIIREDPETKYDKPALYELLFAGCDGLKNEMESITDEDSLPTDFTELTNKIHAFAAIMKGEESINESQTSSKNDILVFNDDDSDSIKAVKITYQESCMMPDIRALIAIKALGDYAEVCGTIPVDLDDDNACQDIKENGLYIKLVTFDMIMVLGILQNSIDVETAEEIFRPEKKAKEEKPIPKEQPVFPKAQLKPADNAVETSKKTPATKNGDKKTTQSSIISVKLEKLDRLLDLVAEIVITESAVTSNPDLKQLKGNLENFSKTSRELKKLTDELQDVVMSIRMIPVATAFSKMNRVVRDMNKKLGKDVELILQGEDTEVDKSVVDILGDPLMHIVRNAVDHGIEDPEERLAEGKTEKARVILSAGYESSEVVIRCIDNGKGMDAKKLLAKGKKNGILTKPENEYSDGDCYNLVMAAGFSTNENITEYSGRGVGMDVVRKNIEKVGGKIIVDSEYGKGSQFTIRIPLSLSIIDVLGVKAGGNHFSIAVSSVREIFHPEENHLITDPDGTQLVMLRDKCLPVIKLSETFKIKSQLTNLTDGIMLYCKEQGKSAAIFADELTSEQQIVVKPLSPILSQFNLKEKGISGCSILADGSITLIADVNEIFKQNKISAKNSMN